MAKLTKLLKAKEESAQLVKISWWCAYKFSKMFTFCGSWTRINR